MEDELSVCSASQLEETLADTEDERSAGRSRDLATRRIEPSLQPQLDPVAQAQEASHTERQQP